MLGRWYLLLDALESWRMSQRRSGSLLLVIGAFKLVKAGALVALAIGALSLMHDTDVSTTLRHVANSFRIDPHNRLINRAMSAVSGLDTRRLAELGIGTFLYAAVFLIEGIGLLLRKGWAEYLTIAVTASFIPFEIYELIHKPSAIKTIAIALNALIVVYLVARHWPKLRRLARG